MTSTLYRVSRRGELKGTYPLEKKADGTMWVKGSGPLLDSETPEFTAMGKDKIVGLIKAGKFSEIPAACYAREGLSATGLEVKSYDDIRREDMAAMTPAQKERIRISNLYAKANARRNAEDDNNEMDYYRIKGEADAALKAWREANPKEAAEEKAKDLECEAAGMEDKAKGAMLFDMDGSLTAEDQQRRHDDYLVKAAELRKQAAELRK